jgi:hypothetical protein
MAGDKSDEIKSEEFRPSQANVSLSAASRSSSIRANIFLALTHRDIKRVPSRNLIRHFMLPVAGILLRFFFFLALLSLSLARSSAGIVVYVCILAEEAKWEIGDCQRCTSHVSPPCACMISAIIILFFVESLLNCERKLWFKWGFFYVHLESVGLWLVKFISLSHLDGA